MRKVALIIIFLLLFFFPFTERCLPQQDSITITTYYPAPYGSYRELAAHRMKIGRNYSAVSVSVGDDNLIVEGRVGIGTTNPQQSLDVVGGATFGGTMISGRRHVLLGSDPHAFIELRETDGSGTPYIDFIDDPSTDFDMRIILIDSNSLSIDGGGLVIGAQTIARSTLDVRGTSNTCVQIPYNGNNASLVTTYCPVGYHITLPADLDLGMVTSAATFTCCRVCPNPDVNGDGICND